MAGPEVTEPAPADAREQDAAALEAFLDKWRARWPEWVIAEVFVPAALRGRALAWAALLQELGDAAWAGEDPRPGLAKLGWWQEELRGWTRGVRRHPLGTVLQRVPAPWDALAAALDSLPATRERPGDADEAFAVIATFARAAAAVEMALFSAPPEGRPSPRPGPPDNQGEADLVAAWLLQSRFVHGNDAHVPLALLAAAGEGDPGNAWATELRRRWPSDVSRHRPRRLWSSLARGRLEGGGPQQPSSGWSTLWRAWRAARG